MSEHEPLQITIESEDEKRLRKELETRTDAESKRMLRFLNMPDLTRTETSPLYELAQRIISLPEFQNFDRIQVPEIVPVRESFDLFNMPKDHPARSKSDTYYVDEENILRTHTTIMWYYYVNHPEVKKKIEQGLPLGSLSYGKVYRKDEIDRNHMNIFHQMDGWYLHPTKDRTLELDSLKTVLADIAKAIFGPEVKYRFNEDKFPYTDPSLEMEVQVGERWIELLGSGMVRQSVLAALGIPEGMYNGWAFGFGLERLAITSMELPDIRLLWSTDERVVKQLKLGQKFKEVTKYPTITRDISFIVDKSFEPNNYFDLIRDLGGDLVLEVTLLDKFENAEKFGPDKVSYTYRITYGSFDRTLEAKEVDPIQKNIYDETAKQFNAQLR